MHLENESFIERVSESCLRFYTNIIFVHFVNDSMASKKTIILAVVVVIIIAFVAIAIGSSEDKDPEARYDYTMESIDSYIGIFGNTITPDEGKQFILVTVVIANDSYEDGISTNPYILEWIITANGIEYNYMNMEANYPTEDTVTVKIGGSTEYSNVFEIPAEISIEDISFKLHWDIGTGPEFIQDDTLL